MPDFILWKCAVSDATKSDAERWVYDLLTSIRPMLAPLSVSGQRCPIENLRFEKTAVYNYGKCNIQDWVAAVPTDAAAMVEFMAHKERTVALHGAADGGQDHRPWKSGGGFLFRCVGFVDPWNNLVIEFQIATAPDKPDASLPV